MFVTPIRPLLGGSGLGMRAGIVLEALAKDFEVSVMAIPVVGEPSSGLPVSLGLPTKILPVTEPAGFRRLLEIQDPQRRLACLAMYPQPALMRFATPDAIATARAAFPGQEFDVVHVFRFYMAPFADAFVQGPGHGQARRWLDLDELESQTHLRLAALCDGAGDPLRAAMERAEAAKYSQSERQFLPLFDRVFVCSQPERSRLSGLCGEARTAVVPNGVRMPLYTAAPQAGQPFEFLFTGSLGYLPNCDAALFLCGEVLPLLRRRSARPFRITIAGSGPPPSVRELARHPEVRVIADVPDMAPVYASASAVVVPLRAGGGTRIKILEAFSYRRPVVSTPIGAEGLAVSHGEQLLLGATAEEFAAQCLGLLNDSIGGARMANRAVEWVRQHHTVDQVRASLRPHLATSV